MRTGDRMIRLTRQKRALFFACLLSGIFSAYGTEKPSIAHAVTDTTYRRIDGHDFVVSLEIVDGTINETRSVDGTAVTQQDYERELIKAEKAERDRETRRVRAAACKKAAEMRLIRKKAVRRLIQLGLEHVHAELKHINEYELEPHLLWNAQTIGSREEYERLLKILIPEAKQLLQSDNNDDNDDTETLEYIESYATQLEDYAQRLSALFLESVNHVIAHTQDTKLLKRLMEIA